MLLPVNCFQNQWMKALRYSNMGNLADAFFLKRSETRVLQKDLQQLFVKKTSLMVIFGKSL